MDFRRSLSVMLLTAVCALAAGTVGAQNVFVSPNNPQQPTQTPPPSSSGVPIAPYVAPPRTGNSQGSVRPTTPTTLPRAGNSAATGNQARSPIDLPDEVPDDNADFAAQHLGIEDKPSASRRALLSYSPEEVQAARDAYENMAKTNPEMAANNPLNLIELMARSQRRENALSDKINASCVSGVIKILISQPTFSGKPEAEANLDKNAMAPLATVFSDLCSDPLMRDMVAKNVHLITIVNTASAPAGEIIASSGVVTLRDDFTRTEAMPASQMRSAIKDALTKMSQLDQRNQQNQQNDHQHGGRQR